LQYRTNLGIDKISIAVGYKNLYPLSIISIILRIVFAKKYFFS